MPKPMPVIYPDDDIGRKMLFGLLDAQAALLDVYRANATASGFVTTTKDGVEPMPQAREIARILDGSRSTFATIERRMRYYPARS